MSHGQVQQGDAKAGQILLLAHTAPYEHVDFQSLSRKIPGHFHVVLDVFPHEKHGDIVLVATVSCSLDGRYGEKNRLHVRLFGEEQPALWQHGEACDRKCTLYMTNTAQSAHDKNIMTKPSFVNLETIFTWPAKEFEKRPWSLRACSLQLAFTRIGSRFTRATLDCAVTADNIPGWRYLKPAGEKDLVEGRLVWLAQEHQRTVDFRPRRLTKPVTIGFQAGIILSSEKEEAEVEVLLIEDYSTLDAPKYNTSLLTYPGLSLSRLSDNSNQARANFDSATAIMILRDDADSLVENRLTSDFVILRPSFKYPKQDICIYPEIFSMGRQFLCPKSLDRLHAKRPLEVAPRIYPAVAQRRKRELAQQHAHLSQGISELIDRRDHQIPMLITTAEQEINVQRALEEVATQKVIAAHNGQHYKSVKELTDALRVAKAEREEIREAKKTLEQDVRRWHQELITIEERLADARRKNEICDVERACEWRRRRAAGY